MREVAGGLVFPEGPVALPDGSIVLVEVLAGRISRISHDGKRQTIAEPGGGPNGMALGPDGRVYICNNGGMSLQYLMMAVSGAHPDDIELPPSHGRIEVLNLDTGAVGVLYEACDGAPLISPNDIVFDKAGGFYFTDVGRYRREPRQPGAIYYAKTDGSLIQRAAGGLGAVNGIGLSADERVLYTAETPTSRLWAFDVRKPGMLATKEGVGGGARLVYQGSDLLFDSLALDEDGFVCVAAARHGAITRISPDGEARHIELPGGKTGMPTNICFGGPDLKTAYVTMGFAGTLLALDWPVAGLPLNFLNR